MNTAHEIEVEALRLPPVERERLARRMWESLVADPDAAGSPDVDTTGLEVTVERDSELDGGGVKAIGPEEFRRRTGESG